MNKRAVYFFILSLLLCIIAAGTQASAENLITHETTTGNTFFKLANNKVILEVTVKDGELISDTLRTSPGWPIKNNPTVKIKTDADFGLDIQWTDWQAPGKIHNGENPVIISKRFFKLASSKNGENQDGSKELEMIFASPDFPLEVRLVYKLDKDAFFVRRQLSIRDPKEGNHFLQWIWPRYGTILGKLSILKDGGFGNPLAILAGNGGAFFGLEYPAAENKLKPKGPEVTRILTGQEMGMKIGKDWICSEWSVAGLALDTYVKLWFEKYLDTVRVVPLKPYLLYNSWYDVRSPEYTKRPEDVMNETNVLRIVNDFKREMVEKRGLVLDAFVLDDGWDVYKSDWELRKTEFPNGLKPISDELKKMGTALGIWFGPTGGYSYRKWRLEYMKEHGYEVVGDQLCVAGTNYHNLLKKRVTDFVKNEGVAYYKWDGIQFSCSEPNHGHPVGIYSRRAVMETVKDLGTSVRELNPSAFLNITSGTWLSPWWTKYANMIWMQGYDYGYANVPSISQRDAAITYRDSVLYQDYIVNDFWFPLSNLMTHGIIKGYLERLGSETETLEKFTDDVNLYFARGVTMYELYISPNILNDGEWNAIGNAIRWAKDRFDILKHTQMIGGNPENRESYGYVHFSGSRGILALRNPFIDHSQLKVKLDPAFGLDSKASSLVLEKVYPTRWISPRLYSAGTEIEIPLNGYETAIYEIYPIEEAKEPLLAGVVFDVTKEKEKNYTVNVHSIEPGARLLNPELIKQIKYEGKEVSLGEFKLPITPLPVLFKDGTIKTLSTSTTVTFTISHSPASAQLCFLLEPEIHGKKDTPVYEAKTSGDKKDSGPVISVFIDGKKCETEVEKQEGQWAWIKIKMNSASLTPGTHNAEIRIVPLKKEENWAGKVSAYVVYFGKPKPVEIGFDLVNDLPQQRPMLLLPLASEGDKASVFLAASGGQNPF